VKLDQQLNPTGFPLRGREIPPMGAGMTQVTLLRCRLLNHDMIKVMGCWCRRRNAAFSQSEKLSVRYRVNR
jgi:hypothetical protein